MLAIRVVIDSVSAVAIEVAFVVVAQHDVYALDGCNLFGLKLCITARYSDYGIGVAAMYLADNIATFLIGVLRYGTAIDNRYIGGC